MRVQRLVMPGSRVESWTLLVGLFLLAAERDPPALSLIAACPARPGGREKEGVVRSEKFDTCPGWFVVPGVGRVRSAVLTIALAGAAAFSGRGADGLGAARRTIA